MSMSAERVKFWRAEMKTLDTLYRERSKDWQKLLDLYDLRFERKIRDLDVSEMIRVPIIYPIVRQVIATIAFNYPKLFFTVEDDEGAGVEVADVLERAASAFLRLTHAKEHVHQAIFDALFCGVGWLRLDYNPPGDDLIPPYVANDAMSEDLVAVSRVPPGFVHLDPQCPPHAFGHARYIRERMWLPLEQLRQDKSLRYRGEIKATVVDDRDELAFGEVMRDHQESPEDTAVRESIKNGEFVLVDRIHDRMTRRLIMFAEGMEAPIQDIAHPFARMSFPTSYDVLGRPLLDTDGQTQIVDLDNGQEAAGWLVENGFPFIPVKFDLSSRGFYPVPHVEYLKDLQNVIVESMSRQSAMLKRIARQGLLRRSEVDANPELANRLRLGVDGEFQVVEDPDSAVRELNWGSVPGEQYALEDRARAYADITSRVNELTQSGGDEARTATEAGLLAAAASINREWLENKVAGAYESVVRNAFQIMGDPRYTPEDFAINVAPDGDVKVIRALRGADFLYNFRINVQAGSTRPLFEQLQRSQAVDFYDRAIQRPNFDQMELDKFLASAYEVVDPEKLLKDDLNEEAVRAAQLENDFILSRLQDPGVVPGQDNLAHLEAHPQIQAHPRYQQVVQAAQMRDPAGNMLNLQAVQTLQGINQIVQQHMAAHQQAEQEKQRGVTTRPTAGRTPIMGVQGQVQSNAQQLSEQVQADTVDVQG